MVSLVLLSHSMKLVEGIKDLASEMAAGIPLYIAGGNSEGGLGSDYELIKKVLGQAQNPEGVIILYDIGSSAMMAETVLDELDDDTRSLYKIIKAPLVEGAVVASVAIKTGSNFDDTLAELKEIEIIK